MNQSILVFMSLVTIFIFSLSVNSSASDRWLGDVLAVETAADISSPPSLEVMQQSYIAQVGIRKSVLQTPLQILDKKYARGIGTYATSEIIVRLPRPAKSFQAEIGIDNNIQTNAKLGTAIFVIEANGKELYRSDVVKGSSAPVKIKVDLKGAKTFILRALDAGDGPEYDEANWADAFITMDDGKKLWLDDFNVYLKPADFSKDVPFSFTYHGMSSTELLPLWTKTEKDLKLSDGKRQHIVTFTDPATALEVRYEATLFDGFPAIDWVVYFRNNGVTDTPIIENIRAMDMHVTPASGENIVFHHSHGSTSSAVDFLPIDEALEPGKEVNLAPVEGRSSDTTLPFFNMQWSGGGVIGAIGWTGQWTMRAARDAGSVLTLLAGQETTHLKLHPGEMIRTPRMLLLAWRGNDSITGHNKLRKLLAKYYLPRANGELVYPAVTENTWFFPTPANGADEKTQLALIDAASRIGVEYYWQDAGWFEGNVGNWYPEKSRYPRGLRPLGDAAHKKGMKFVLWFEPERVYRDSLIFREHPEWVMQVRAEDINKTWLPFDEHRLFRLGDPDARKWLTDMLSKCIEDWGVDIYRQDFNLPGATYFWLAGDTPDRQGISENMYIQGLYAMWDELLRRHPGLVIDNCASGGRRIDLEMMSRSVIMWRSDTQCVGKPMPIQDQVQTAGLSLYVPLHSASVWSFDPYEWRSVATSGTNLCMDYRRPDFDREAAKRMIKEVKELRPCWQGDYYPLMGINSDEAQWCAWQFDRPDLDAGFAMYFRRPKCNYIAVESGLQGLDLEASYEVSFPDTGMKKIMKGKDLAKMPVMIRKAPASVLIIYKKKP